MTERRDETAFLADVKQSYNEIDASDPLQKLRAHSWKQFEEIQLPHKKHEAFRYLPLKKLYENICQPTGQREISPESYVEAVYPECKDSLLVFINGHFAPEHSRLDALNGQLIVTPLNDAIRPYGAFLNNRWAQSAKVEQDPFALLNGALHQNGALLYVPPKKAISTPLQILYVEDVEAGELTPHLMPRLHLFAGAFSELKVVTKRFSLSNAPCLSNEVCDIVLEEGARVSLHQTNWGMASEAWRLAALRATLKRGSFLEALQITNGAQTNRNDYHVQLCGEGSEALLYGLSGMADKKQSHTHILMDHQAPHCESSQVFKTVLEDQSRSSFEGKILVRQKAQKTNAYQLNNNLVLSERAHADSKPNLEIFADDVKASHGATVGQLDQDQLLYLRTRGYSKEKATAQLISAFAHTLIDRISLSSQKIEADQLFQQQLL